MTVRLSRAIPKADRAHVRRWWLWLALGLTACAADPERTQVLPIDPTKTIAVDDSVLEFSMDQEIRVIQTNGVRADTSPPRQVHVVRRRDPRGGWLTATSHQRTWATSATSDSVTASVELSDTQGEVVMRNHKGEPIRQVTSARGPATTTAKGTALKYVPEILRASRPAPARLQRNSDPDGWLRRLLHRSGSGVAASGLLAAGASRGAPSGGKDRYILPLPAGLMEVTLDPASGLVVEENVMEGEKLVARSQYGYQAIRGGELIRTYERHEMLASGAEGVHRVLEITTTNPILRRVSGDYR